MTVKITLACTECKQRNYNKEKNKKNSPDRLEMKKYCRFCKKHTLHRETKDRSLEMADNKAATAAAQTQSDKPKKNDGVKKVSFFGKVKNFFKGIGKYFKDTKSELKKVVWPSKHDVKNNTITVIVVVLIAAVVLIALDLIFGGAIHLLIGA